MYMPIAIYTYVKESDEGDYDPDQDDVDEEEDASEEEEDEDGRPSAAKRAKLDEAKSSGAGPSAAE